MSIFTNPANAAAAEAAAYIRALLELLGDQDPMHILESQMENLQALIEGVDKDLLMKPEREGKWAIIEVLQHLADSELVWAYRLRMVVAHDRPQITGYDQDLWGRRLNYVKLPLEPALQQIRILRQGNIRLLRSLSPDQLQRVGVHNERGEESVSQMIKLYAGHDLVHLNQIHRIKQEVC